ncbi:rod-binding protein [Phaeobacter sp. BS52]|uniref:rod-binding protein n=1 Tax=Phaeobacter sp. BS52 TaxID=2907241 RepID=UPI00386B0E0D
MEPIAQLPAMQRPAAITSPPQDPLRKAAQELEATFLTEMLKSAGLGESRETMGGGAGEDQFSSFLVRAQAEQITKAGGVGLAESLYHALKEAQDND